MHQRSDLDHRDLGELAESYVTRRCHSVESSQSSHIGPRLLRLNKKGPVQKDRPYVSPRAGPAEAGHYVCIYSTSPAGGRPSIGSSVSKAYSISRSRSRSSSAGCGATGGGGGSSAGIRTWRYHSKPVPAGMRRPIVTFSFRPRRWSIFPEMDASVRTRVVSWKLAAEMNESVESDALVIPSSIGCAVAGRPPA